MRTRRLRIKPYSNPSLLGPINPQNRHAETLPLRWSRRRGAPTKTVLIAENGTSLARVDITNTFPDSDPDPEPAAEVIETEPAFRAENRRPREGGGAVGQKGPSDGHGFDPDDCRSRGVGTASETDYNCQNVPTEAGTQTHRARRRRSRFSRPRPGEGSPPHHANATVAPCLIPESPVRGRSQSPVVVMISASRRQTLTSWSSSDWRSSLC
jgi:hypothetical protein